jgi:large subunit ribosomal protein L28
MSRRCELSGKGVLVGHRVSHSNIKTKHRFLPNLQNITLHSESLNQDFKFRITAHALRSVDHNGGLDAFLTKNSGALLSDKALGVKMAIARKLSEA